jgi:glycosyltransferase involved in cell wall biosynthesis
MNSTGKLIQSRCAARRTLSCVAVLFVFAATGHSQEHASAGTDTGNARSEITGSSLKTCDLAVALGAPGSRILPAQPIPTHINIMGTRYWDLVYTVNGNRQTGVPLVQLNDSVLGPAGGPDDIGSFYVIPKLSMLLGLPVSHSIDIFYGGLLLFAFLASLGGFFLSCRGLLARALALLGLLLLTALAYRVGDVYIFHFVTAVIAIPWMFLLIRRSANLRLQLPIFLFLMGLLIGIADAVRSHAGTAALIFLCSILLFQVSAAHRRKMALLLCLAVGLLLPKLFFSRLVAERDAFLIAQCPEYKMLTAQHPLWHTMYAGFGYLQNDYGLRWDDTVSYRKVQSIAPGTVYASEDYERILKHEVLLLVRRQPLYVFMTLASKAGVILCVLLLGSNLGLLATALHPKPWPIELSFSLSIAFSSLPALVAIPAPEYLLGLISFAVLYAIVSLSFALESSAERKVRWHWIHQPEHNDAEAQRVLAKPARVHVLVLSGEAADAQRLVENRFPGCECVFLPKRGLREAGWRGQIKALGSLHGAALVFFLRSLSELQEPQLTVLSSLLHRCQLTVLADSDGQLIEYGRLAWLRVLPKFLVSAVSDLCVFVISWLSLRLLQTVARPVQTRELSPEDVDLAYLYPYPLDSALAGGALSHVEGFLSGVAGCGGKCEIFSGRTLAVQIFARHLIPAKRRLFLFRESLMLSYNLRFVWSVRNSLKGRGLAGLYQRHGRFTVAGALLSFWLRIPFILEYNGSETWTANHWDPARFRTWLRLCEEVSLARAHLIVVVSEALRKELLERGIPEERILLNPNAVDPEVFQPGCGGREVRTQLGFAATDIVVAFVGTFNYWHGIRVLEQTIQHLFLGRARDGIAARLRFLLVGEGPLCAETRRNLERDAGGRVFFTGVVPHVQVPAYLDAADILLSPHVPMPDGRPFFGSPTKLFEYMAMAKAIIASDLDQLSRILQHQRSAWLVEPGNASELASAILLLARDPQLRNQLGENARAAAVAQHTWQQNAERVLHRIRGSVTQPIVRSVVAAKGA